MTDVRSATSALTPEAGVELNEVVKALDAELSTATVPDYQGAVNGLQFANNGRIHHVASAVDSSRHAIDEAARIGANLLIVHHGLFWGGAQPIVGVNYDKYNALIRGNIAVYSSHLPLDTHPALGNNVRLAEALSLSPAGGFGQYRGVSVGVQGLADEPTDELIRRVTEYSTRLGGTVRTSTPVAGRRTKRWAICTGSGASTETIVEAVASGIDTLIVGEGPHHATVGAIEHDLCIVFAGHYATEALGVQALGEFVEKRFGVPWTFLYLPTGS